MTPFPEYAAEAIWTLLSLGLLWILLHWAFQAYRIDRFRFQLFSLRAELFDLGMHGEISFDHPVYADLRGTLNGFLRFADRLSLLSSILISREIRKMIAAGEVVVVMKSEWETSAEALDPGLCVQLKDIRARMHLAVFEQILFSSPAFLLTCLPFLLYGLIKFAAEKLVWNVFQKLYLALERWFERAVRPLDHFALQVGTSA